MLRRILIWEWDLYVKALTHFVSHDLFFKPWNEAFATEFKLSVFRGAALESFSINTSVASRITLSPISAASRPSTSLYVKLLCEMRQFMRNDIIGCSPDFLLNTQGINANQFNGWGNLEGHRKFEILTRHDRSCVNAGSLNGTISSC